MNEEKIYIPPFLTELISENEMEIYDMVLGDKKTRKASRKKRVKREVRRRELMAAFKAGAEAMRSLAESQCGHDDELVRSLPIPEFKL